MSMHTSHVSRSCHGCCHALDRRQFLHRCGATAAAATGSLTPLAGQANEAQSDEKVRVATVFLSNINIREIWPYPEFDTESRRREILSRLRADCPKIDFVPVSVEQPQDVQRAVALKSSVDGYLIYTMTLDWNHRPALVDIAQVGKPTLVVDEFLGGSGVFLTGYSELCSRGIPAGGVSTTRLDDLVTVARLFERVRQPGMTPAAFAEQCERKYRQTFSAVETSEVAQDSLVPNDIGNCVDRFRKSRFLIVGRGRHGQEQEFLGTKGCYVDFAELQELYNEVDTDEAAEWAGRWTTQAIDLKPGDYVGASQPTPEAIHDAAGVYLATLKLLERYGTDAVTMNCLGGFAAGKLPAYPCLGFMQILNDGGLGVCEAMPDDTLSMLMAQILTERPGFVSDPALDTSQNQIVYAHCVGTTKVFGPEGAANGYRIRTLHNRDPRGACSESFMPSGYMTTTFRTNAGRKQLIIHQAKAVGTLDSERGCRTKLVAEVCGDIGKLFDQWNQFGWHRVTVYGDIKEPLAEFGRALGLEIIEEA
jgi:hypothetical protein